MPSRCLSRKFCMEKNLFKLDAAGVKAEAARLGFHACGLSVAGPVDASHSAFFRRWLTHGHYAGMEYMAGHVDLRLNPCLLVEGTQTIVSVAMNYQPLRELPEKQPQLAWYAYGKDYHDLMRQRLRLLLESLQSRYGESLQGRAFCDTAPVLERYWAWRGGLGWIGRHSQLVIPRCGSAFFLGELFLNMQADCYDRPMDSKCGTCMRCVEACPMHAIGEADGLDAARCLSYLTIESREPLIPEEAAARMAPYFYGCDRCLRACPALRMGSPTNEEWFRPSDELLDMTEEKWNRLTVEDYRRLFKGSAVKRAKYDGLMRNINAIKTGSESASKPLLSDTSDSLS